MTAPISLLRPSQICWRLHNAARYLEARPQELRSALFEELVAKAFASVLHLPLYDASCDPHTGPRVTWYGSHSASSRAPSGPDAVAHASGFVVLIEATMKTGTRQWSQEFNECIRHAQDSAQRMNIPSGKLYTAMVTTCLHDLTYGAIRSHNANSEWKVALLETACLAWFVETASLAPTVRHIDCRKLLQDLLDDLERSSSLDVYRKKMRHAARSWAGRVLSLEKNTTVAIKAYEALVRSDHSQTSLSDLLVVLDADADLRKYLGRISAELRPELVAGSLRQESLAAETPIGYTSDMILTPVPLCDFEHRNQRRLEAIRNAVEPT